jgi:undecaprenyl-diphosphatase
MIRGISRARPGAGARSGRRLQVFRGCRGVTEIPPAGPPVRSRVRAPAPSGSPQRGDVLLLAALLAAVLCVWAFVALADRVTEGQTQRLDERILLSMRAGSPSRPRGPAFLPGAMRDLTALGSPSVLTLFVLAVAGFLVVRRQYHALGLLLAATVGGVLLNALLKHVFARPRPPLAFHLTEVRSMSFPSGHAMESAIIYLTMAALLARLVRPRVLQLYFIGLAFLLTLLVGVSRVYLGVHYPTDVLAGWTAGLAWSLLCWMVARYLQQRGKVEPED